MANDNYSSWAVGWTGFAGVMLIIVGVIVAGLGAIANFAWLPYYPVWAIIVISICIAVIWALTANGHDMAESRGDV